MAWNWSGAATGAGVGFAAGGPIGAGAGALIGGGGAGELGLPDPLGDLFGGPTPLSKPDKEDFRFKGQGEQFFQNRGEQLYNRPAVQANLDQFNQSRNLGMGSRQAIDAQINKLGALANDKQNSQAYWQMKAGGAQNMQQALALARSGGSGAAQAASLQQAQLGNAAAGQTLNQQVGIMRAQEIANTNQQISQLQAQQRAMDLQASGLDAQTAMQQAQLELGSQQLGQQGLLGMYGLGQQGAALEQKGGSDYWKTLLGAEAAQSQAEAQQKAGIIGGGAALGAGLLASSDIRGKTDLQPITGAPMITTGGAMTTPEIQGAPMGPSWGQNFMHGYTGGQQAFNAFQTQPAKYNGLVDPEQYLPNISDARAKKLEDENAALKDIVQGRQMVMARSEFGGGEGVRTLQRGAVQPMAPGVAYASGDTAMYHLQPEQLRGVMRATAGLPDIGQGSHERGAAQRDIAQRLRAREQALRDYEASARAMAAAAAAPRASDSLPWQQGGAYGSESMGRSADVARAVGERADQQFYPVAPTPPPPPLTARQQQYANEFVAASDERSKKRIQHLEGLVSDYRERLRPAPARYSPYETAEAAGYDLIGAPGRGPIYPEHDYGSRMPTARFPDVEPHPLAAQARAIPSSAWRYDPAHAVQANLRNGQPPNAEFGNAVKTGPMAQELAAIPATRGAVSQGPDGMLQIDGGQVAMSGLGMIGDLARQNAELEHRLQLLELKGKGKTAAALASKPSYDIDDPAMWWGPGF